MKHVNCITINTDASFHPTKKVGGYAFYIVCDLFKIQKSGMFRKKPTNSTDAEIMCIANALHTLAAQRELPSTRKIIINCDSLNAFELIKKKSTYNSGRMAAMKMRAVRDNTSIRGCIMPDFEFRHVKAHSGIKDARSIVNEWCDKEAKKWMRKALEKTATKTEHP